MEYESGKLESFDGTVLDHRVYGQGDRWLVLVNGLGSTYGTWEPLIERLQPGWRVLVWDLRGMFGSQVPEDQTRLRMIDHFRDMELLMDRYGITDAVACGWSMGVQIVLEAYGHLPERFSRLVLLAGIDGRFFSRCFHVPAARLLIPAGMEVTSRLSRVVGRAVPRVVGWEGLGRWALRLGVTTRNPEVLAREARNFLRLDWAAYPRMAKAMELDTQARILPRIRVPVLLLAGGRDPMAPPDIMLEMGRAIPDSKLVVVPGGTHYLIYEYPDVVIPEIVGFIGG